MGRDKTPNLDRVTLVVPVIDLAHVAPTIANLADIQSQLRVNSLDVVIEIDPTRFLPLSPSPSPEFQAALNTDIDRLNELAKEK